MGGPDPPCWPCQLSSSPARSWDFSASMTFLFLASYWFFGAQRINTRTVLIPHSPVTLSLLSARHYEFTGSTMLMKCSVCARRVTVESCPCRAQGQKLAASSDGSLSPCDNQLRDYVAPK